MPSPKLSLTRRLSRMLILSLAFAAATLSLSFVSQAQTETIIYSVPSQRDGGMSEGLVLDPTGNLYGTTPYGGASQFGCGSVFELSPVAGGGWQEKTLHGFNCSDGYLPFAGLAIDSAGNLYGTTESGGTAGGGTVFELSPVAGGSWHFTGLHGFSGGADGGDLIGGVVLDSSGNLYGTTASGGAHGEGTIFKLTPIAGGGWHFATLHSFESGPGGRISRAGLTIDSAGNLYGTTEVGGISAACGGGGCGVVFELSPVSGGGWHYSVLHAFNQADGAYPVAGVTLDAAGNVYGTTQGGGSGTYYCNFYGCGVVFKLSPLAGGVWHETLIHSFSGNLDGAYPTAAVTLDALGNVYGTTNFGGDGAGLVFEFSPISGGGWPQTILHNFTGRPDGNVPVGPVIFDTSGNLYGNTQEGGTNNHGAIYEITP
jgi:uncharacterized repeat protein (TIGR03803 family)